MDGNDDGRVSEVGALYIEEEESGELVGGSEVGQLKITILEVVAKG